MPRSLRTLAVAAVVLVVPPVASAQVAWWPGDPWGPWAPSGPRSVELVPWGWGAAWGRGAYQYELPSCYRIGRCSIDDIVHHLDRPDRLDRLAPAAPARPPVLVYEATRRAPGDPRQVQPAYARSGSVRPQFEASGAVRE